MKPKKTLLLSFLVLVLGLNTISSQQIEVSASRQDVLNSIIRLHKIFGHDENNFFVIKYSGTQYYIEKLDRNLNSVREESIKLFKGLRTYKLETAIHFYNELYIFFSHTRINDITLYYQKLDKESLLPLSDPIPVSTIRNIKGAWADFHFALSRHETRFMVACRTKLSWSHDQFNEFYVFGEGFELLWKRKDSFEFKGTGPRDNLYMVDEIGNVSVLSLLKRESIISLIRDYRNLYSIYRYSNEGNEFNEYPVTLDDQYIRGIRIIAGENGDIVCAGLYSDMFKTGVRGTFFFKIDGTSGQVYERHISPFDEAVMAELASLKEPIIRDEELINYVISDIVLRENGKVILISEQIFHQSYNTFNNLIVTNLDLNGGVYWTRVIPKRQNFNLNNEIADVDLLNYRDFIMATGYVDPNEDNLCSYALLAPLDGTGIVLFYNDDIRNMNQSQFYKAFSRPKKSYLLAVAIDEFGNITKTPLIPWKKKALYPAPIRFYDTLRETVVIPAFRNRSINFYKITATL